MRILYDGVYNSNPRSGIHRYFYNIVANMPDDLLKYSSTTVSRTDISNHFIPPINHFRPHRLSYFLEYLWFMKHCYQRNFDLIHSAYYNLSKACYHQISNGVPHIITVHDLIHELHDGINEKIINLRRNIIENSAAIIAVSSSTKNDLVNFYNSIRPEKVHVIQHGINLPQNEHRIKIKKDNKNHFLLYVGHREGYKNFSSLLPIIKELSKTENIVLKVVGPERTIEEECEIKKYGISSNIKFLSNVSDEEIKFLYLNSLALIYPSLYEGFGIPLIEAMAYGSIPIALRTSSIPEVLGDAGIILNNNEFMKLTLIIKELIYKPVHRAKLKSQSRKRAKKFSIENNIKKTIEVYNTVLSIKI